MLKTLWGTLRRALARMGRYEMAAIYPATVAALDRLRGRDAR